MDIPSHVKLKSTLKRGSVYYFTEDSPKFRSSEPHYFIVVNKEPHSEELLVLVCASSKIDKAQKRIKALRYPKETLVYVSPNEYEHFTKETVISCNSIFEHDIQHLVKKLDAEELKICSPPDNSFIESIIQGLKISPRIDRKIKERL